MLGWLSFHCWGWLSLSPMIMSTAAGQANCLRKHCFFVQGFHVPRPGRLLSSPLAFPSPLLSSPPLPLLLSSPLLLSPLAISSLAVLFSSPPVLLSSCPPSSLLSSSPLSLRILSSLIFSRYIAVLGLELVSYMSVPSTKLMFLGWLCHITSPTPTTWSFGITALLPATFTCSVDYSPIPI